MCKLFVDCTDSVPRQRTIRKDFYCSLPRPPFNSSRTESSAVICGAAVQRHECHWINEFHVLEDRAISVSALSTAPHSWKAWNRKSLLTYIIKMLSKPRRNGNIQLPVQSRGGSWSCISAEVQACGRSACRSLMLKCWRCAMLWRWSLMTPTQSWGCPSTDLRAVHMHPSDGGLLLSGFVGTQDWQQLQWLLLESMKLHASLWSQCRAPART